MFGLAYDELAVVVGTFVLAARVLYALARVLWAWAVDRPFVGLTIWTMQVTGFALAAVAVGLVSLSGIPRGARPIAYPVAGFFGLFFGFLLDLFLSHRQYRLYLWLAARRVPLYCEQLTAPDAEMRKHAAERLGLLGPYARPAHPDLIATLKDESADVRAAAALAVVLTVPEPEDAETPKAVRAALRDPDPRVRACAAALLVNFGAAAPDEVLPALCDGVVRTEEGCAAHAAHALTLLGPAAAPAIPALREAALDRVPPNDLAASALVAVGPAAIPVLIELLDRGDMVAKSTAASAIGNMGEPGRAALPALRKLALKTSDMAHHAAKTAIKKLGGDIA